jgi:hypothetical protein
MLCSSIELERRRKWSRPRDVEHNTFLLQVITFVVVCADGNSCTQTEASVTTSTHKIPYIAEQKQTPWPSVLKRTLSTEPLPLVGEI